VILAGLRRAGVPEEALEFYSIHVEAEEEHGDNAERALAPYVQSLQQQALVRHAFRWTVIAITGMQRGFDAYLTCREGTVSRSGAFRLVGVVLLVASRSAAAWAVCDPAGADALDIAGARATSACRRNRTGRGGRRKPTPT